jgi:hypothetical protein
MQIIYNFIINPYKTPLKFKGTKPYIECFSIILLVCFVRLVDLSFLSLFQKTLFLIIMFFFSCFIITLQSAALDFVAQLFKLKSHTVALFCWLGISWLPFCLSAPAKLISNASGSLSNIATLTTLFSFCLVIFFQITTIKWIYETSTLRSILIYLIPSGIIACFSFIIILLGGAFVISSLLLL